MFIRVCLITKRNFILICMFDVRSVWSVRPDPWTRISTRSSARADSWVLVRFKREICLGSFLQMILGFKKKMELLSVYPSVKKEKNLHIFCHRDWILSHCSSSKKSIKVQRLAWPQQLRGETEQHRHGDPLIPGLWDCSSGNRLTYLPIYHCY